MTPHEILVDLGKKLDKYFDENDLQSLCFDLGIEYDNLPGIIKTRKAQELVKYVDRRGHISELICKCRELRPNAEWPEVATQPQTTSVKKVDRKDELSNRGVDFVLVTALPEERDAVLGKLEGYRKLPPSKDDIRTYFQAELPVTFPDGKTGKYRLIVISLLGMGRVEAATATADAIRRWHPRYIILVGIAGGIAARGVSVGDILISDQIVDYELQKITRQGPEIRWDVHRADPRLLHACNNFMDPSWQKLVQVNRPNANNPSRYSGPIASGDKVVAFSDVLKRYSEVWTKLIGVEMEAAGVATAAFQSTEKPGFFMVRGVSDLADEHKGSEDAERWRPYACDVAASFAIALLKSGPVPLLTPQLPLTVCERLRSGFDSFFTWVKRHIWFSSIVLLISTMMAAVLLIRVAFGCPTLPCSLSQMPDANSFSVRYSDGHEISFESGDVVQITANEQVRVKVTPKGRTKMWCSWSAAKGTLSSGILPFTQECATTYIAPSEGMYDSLAVLAQSSCDAQQAFAGLHIKVTRTRPQP